MSIIEAKAVISARDATAGVFESIAAKINKITAAGRHASGPIAGIAGTIERSGRALHVADNIAGKVASAAAGGLAFGKLAQIAHGVATTYAKFDDLVRYQRAILGMTEGEQKPFIDQAIHGGATSPFNDLQWLSAQLDLAQRGVNKDFIRPITQMASDYAQAMNAELPEAAKTIEGILFSTGKHIADGNEALKVAQRSVDFAVKLAKIGGLDNEDVKAFFKYGGLAGSTAGLSDETTGAMAALMRRANIRGDEAGVAVRAISSKLVAPTQQGRMALMSLGINYDDYLKTPDFFNADHLNQALKTKFGKGVAPNSMAKMTEMLADDEVIGERGNFIEKLTSELGGMFRRGKDGKMNAQDAKGLAKFLDQYYSLGTKNVDSEKLLRDIVAANPSLQQANKLFTDKHGARFLAIARDFALFIDYIQKLKDAPEGFARQIGQERMAGYSGAEKRAEGSWKNVETAIGRAWDPEMTAYKNMIATVNQRFAEADTGTQKLITGFAGAATAIIGFEAAVKAASLLGLLGPNAAALASRLPWLATGGLMMNPWTGIPIAAAGAIYGLHEATTPFAGTTLGQRPAGSEGNARMRRYIASKEEDFRQGVPLEHLTVEGVRTILQGSMSPQLEGTVTVDINVKNDPSPDFVSRITTQVKSWFGAGIRTSGTTGSTGSSMPEAQVGWPQGNN